MGEVKKRGKKCGLMIRTARKSGKQPSVYAELRELAEDVRG
jgi:hypothetical protein